MADGFNIDMDKVRAFVASKARKRKEALDERFDRATRDFDSIVERIVNELTPTRVYQWGSLLDRNRFTEISDIDVAVEGLRSSKEFFEALGIAIDGTSLPVDVVELERVPADVADRIRRKGRLVYERTDS